MSHKPDRELLKRLSEAVKLLRKRNPTKPHAFAMGMQR